MINQHLRGTYGLVAGYEYFNTMYECLESKLYQGWMKTSYPVGQKIFCISGKEAALIHSKKATWVYVDYEKNN